MRTYYFVSHQVSADATATARAAAAYCDTYDPHRALIDPRPLADLRGLLDVDEVANRLPPPQQAAVRRYLQEQVAHFAEQVAPTIPPFPGEAPGTVRFAMLGRDLDGTPAGTVVAIRSGVSVDVFSVLSGWTITDGGRLQQVPLAPPQVAVPPRSPARAGTFEPAPELTNSGRLDFGRDTVRRSGDVLLTITNYIGQFLTMTMHGSPGPGLLVSLLASVAQQAVGEAFSSTSHLLEDIKHLLLQQHITLETDLAKATLTKFEQFRTGHCDLKWVSEIMNAPDPDVADIVEKRAKIDDFVGTMLKALDRPGDFAGAVALMMDDADKVSGDLKEATDSMLKSGGFFLIANLMLSMGCEAYTARETMEGRKAR
jgi:hypothetical protein